MPSTISEQMAFCRRQASGCRQKANEASDKALKKAMLAMEREWLALASSYDLSEPAGDFKAEVQRRFGKRGVPGSRNSESGKH